jgi:hypothetical protein
LILLETETLDLEISFYDSFPSPNLAGFFLDQTSSMRLTLQLASSNRLDKFSATQQHGSY